MILKQDGHSHPELLKIVKKLEFAPTLYSHPGDIISVNPATVRDFKTLQAELATAQFETFLFRNPDEVKPIKVVIRGLHITTTTLDVGNDLKARGFQVVEVNQLRASGKDKRLLPLFLVTLVDDQKSRDIVNVKTVLYTRVTVEDYKSRKDPPQCFKCQRFNHVAKNCNAIARCVKCADTHESKECPSESAIKCANCGQNHTSSYKGCSQFKVARNTYRRALKRKNKNSSERVRQAPPPLQNKRAFPPLNKQNKVLNGTPQVNSTTQNNSQENRPFSGQIPSTVGASRQKPKSNPPKPSNGQGASTIQDVLALLSEASDLTGEILTKKLSLSEAMSRTQK